MNLNSIICKSFSIGGNIVRTCLTKIYLLLKSYLVTQNRVFTLGLCIIFFIADIYVFYKLLTWWIKQYSWFSQHWLVWTYKEGTTMKHNALNKIHSDISYFCLDKIILTVTFIARLHLLHGRSLNWIGYSTKHNIFYFFRAIIFVIDSVTFQREIKDVAEWVFRLWWNWL